MAASVEPIFKAEVIHTGDFEALQNFFEGAGASPREDCGVEQPLALAARGDWRTARTRHEASQPAVKATAGCEETRSRLRGSEASNVLGPRTPGYGPCSSQPRMRAARRGAHPHSENSMIVDSDKERISMSDGGVRPDE